MGLFRKGSKNNDDPILVGRLDNGAEGATNQIKHSKTRSYDIHDPVLTAIRDEEPFQMSANNQPQMTTVSPDLQVRDVFGNVINMPDRSNPTRPRDERPLDTIRGFEYLCTGDERLREEMETSRYGWNPRPNFMSAGRLFPQYDSNPYASNAGGSADGSGNGGNLNGSSGADGRNMISFGNEGGASASASADINAPFKTYDPNAAQPKKKRGLFGRKKK